MHKRATTAEVKFLAAQFRSEHERWPNLTHRLITSNNLDALTRCVIDEINPSEVPVRSSIYTNDWCYHILPDQDDGNRGYEAFALLSRQAYSCQAYPLARLGIEDAPLQFLEFLHFDMIDVRSSPKFRGDDRWTFTCGNPIPYQVWESTLPFGIFLSAATALERKPRHNARHARDSFIYELSQAGDGFTDDLSQGDHCCSVIYQDGQFIHWDDRVLTWGEIAAQANQRFISNPLGSPQAAYGRALNYAKKFGLPHPPQRRSQ